MLNWNETSFIEFLDVIPHIEGDGTYYNFEVSEDNLILELALHPYAGDVHITLSRNQAGEKIEVTDIEIIDCHTAEVSKIENEEFIEFAPGKMFGGRYDEILIVPFNVRLYRTPCLRLSIFSKNF